MPILEDLYKIFGTDKRTEKYKIKMKPFVYGSLNYFNKHTNLDLNNKLIVADIYELGEENIKYGMYLFIDLFWDYIKLNRNKKKTIYLDEIWRLIGITSNRYIASFIYKIFKTIRKYGGSAVGITQDVSDLFGLEDGFYGKSLLSNSSIKILFSLEEENINILNNYMEISEKEKIAIRNLKRGECLICINHNHVIVNIQSSQEEKEVVERRKKDDKNYYSNGKSRD